MEFPVRGEEPPAGLSLRATTQDVGSQGVALNAPKPDENPSGMQGKRDEAMTAKQHKPI
jgi:hypothetical protein